jgi:hypothetical protein
VIPLMGRVMPVAGRLRAFLGHACAAQCTWPEHGGRGVEILRKFTGGVMAGACAPRGGHEKTPAMFRAGVDSGGASKRVARLRFCHSNSHRNTHILNDRFRMGGFRCTWGICRHIRRKFVRTVGLRAIRSNTDTHGGRSFAHPLDGVKDGER